jgi:hypothetical protein
MHHKKKESKKEAHMHEMEAGHKVNKMKKHHKAESKGMKAAMKKMSVKHHSRGK